MPWASNALEDLPFDLLVRGLRFLVTFKIIVETFQTLKFYFHYLRLRAVVIF